MADTRARVGRSRSTRDGNVAGGAFRSEVCRGLGRVALWLTRREHVERDGDYYLAATAGGQPKEPQWIRNLRAASTATVEVGRDRRVMSVEVLRGAESDAAWKDVIVATYPSFGSYEAKSGRKIAVARLTPSA